MTNWVIFMTFTNEAGWQIGKVDHVIKSVYTDDYDSCTDLNKGYGNIHAYYLKDPTL